MALNTTITKNRKKQQPDQSATSSSKLNKELQNEIIERLTQNFAIKHIILFGSYASGTPHEDSDVDLIVVLDEPGVAENYDQKIKRQVNVRLSIIDICKKIPIDVFVYTRDEWKRLLQINSSFIREINDTGITLV